MYIQLFLAVRVWLILSLVFSLFACDDSSELPTIDPVVYPITFELIDYSTDTPVFYTVNDEGYQETSTVSQDLNNFLQEEVFDVLLPEVQQEFSLQGIRLESETACAVAFYDVSTEEANWTSPSLLYEWSETELIIFDSTRQFSIPFIYSEVDQRLDLCDWAFIYIRRLEEGGQVFSSLDFPTCQRLNLLNANDWVSAYILEAGLIESDSLCIIPLTRHYHQR